MKIDIKQKNGVIQFVYLNNGDVFEYGGDYYLKISSDKSENTFSFTNDICTTFKSTEFVNRVSAKVVVER